VAVEIFRDDDRGYEAWLAAHPSGWVVNARSSPSAAYLKLHRAECAMISQLQAGYSRWTTGGYIRIGAERREELEAWARHTFAAGLQDSCYCVQYGTGRARRRPTAQALRTRPSPPRPGRRS
jgi:hypothetical protein